MQGKRTNRINHLIQMELSQLVLLKIKDPRLRMITVTEVSVTPDLKQAYVYYSILGDDQVKQDSLKAFQKAAGFLQREISSILKLRFTPKLFFRIDDSLDRGMEIDRVLHTLKKEQEKGS